MTRLLSLVGLMRVSEHKRRTDSFFEQFESLNDDLDEMTAKFKQAVADLEKQAGEIALLKSDVSELQGHLYDARHDLGVSRQQAAELLPDALAMRRKRQRDRDLKAAKAARKDHTHA